MTMPTPRSAHPEDVELRDLFCALCGETAAANQRQNVESILLHPMFQRKLRSACGVVLKRWAQHDDLAADVLQEAICILETRLCAGKLASQSGGPEKFDAWIWEVVLSTTRRAWEKCRPIWLEKHVLIGSDELAAMEQPAGEAVDPGDLLLAIDRVKNPLLRQTLKDWFHCLTLAESAQAQGLWISQVWELRQRAAEELRRIWLDE